MYVHTYVSIYMYVCMNTCMHVRLYMYIYVCMYIYICVRDNVSFRIVRGKHTSPLRFDVQVNIQSE